VVSLSDRVTNLEKEVTGYIDRRESTCYGLAALDEYLKKQGQSKEEIEVEKSRNQTLMRVQWIQVAGLIIVALIALLNP
jgi:hypothetical protein